MKCLLFFILLFISTVTFCKETEVSVYNTYLQPPIVNFDESGLARSLVDFLNTTLKGEYRFILRNLPRQRLLKYHLSKEEKFSELAIFLSPVFIGDQGKKRFIWSQPLFSDYNVLVFNKNQKIQVKTLVDLKGMRFSTVRGYRYFKLDEMILKNELSKLESSNEETSLRQVQMGRADFTQMNRLFFASLSERKEFHKDQFKSIKIPGEPAFDRHIVFGKAVSPVLIKKVNKAIEILPCDKAWQEYAKRFDISLRKCH